MTQQNNEAFEVWHSSSEGKESRNYNHSFAYTAKANFNAGWQAAKADSKREIAIALAQLDRLISRNDELQANINVLHKFIYWECDVYLNGQNPEFSKKYRELLTSTPAQSLQAHDDEVIERCAKSCENLITESFSKPLSFDDIAKAIRALKGKHEEYRQLI